MNDIEIFYDFYALYTHVYKYGVNVCDFYSVSLFLQDSSYH